MSLARSGILSKIEEKYSFTRKVEPKSEGEAIVFVGGIATNSDGDQTPIDRLEIGSLGLRVTLFGSTSTARSVLDHVCEQIDEEKLFPPLKDGKKEETHQTTCKFQVDVSPAAFLSDKFCQYLEKVSRKFPKKGFSTEIHPMAFGAAFLFRPNLADLAARSPDISELSDILRTASTYNRFVIGIENPKDFAEKIYIVDSFLPSEKLIEAIKILESILST